MVQDKLHMYFTYHRMKTYMSAGVTAVMDSAPDHRDPDYPPPRWVGRRGFQQEDAFCLSGWSCVERTQGSDRESEWAAGVDLGKSAWEGGTAERGCGGTCAGLTRQDARLLWGGEMAHRQQGCCALIGWQRCWRTLPDAPECPGTKEKLFMFHLTFRLSSTSDI